MNKKVFYISMLTILIICSFTLAAQTYSVTVDSTFGFKFRGDYAGVVYASPYTIGPYPEPFTVILEPIGLARNHGCGGMIGWDSHWLHILELESWDLDQMTATTPDVTIVTTESQPEITARAQWRTITYGDGSFTVDNPGIITWFCPPRDNVLVGQEFSLTQVIHPPENAVFELDILYNPAVLQVISISRDDRSYVQSFDTSRTGVISLTGSHSAGTYPYLVITWQAIAEGFSSLEFEFTRFEDAAGNQLLVNNNPAAGSSCSIAAKRSIYYYGDIDTDGQVTVIDALKLARHCVGTYTISTTSMDLNLGDLNRDGSIDIVDALIIARYYIGLEPVVPLF